MQAASIKSTSALAPRGVSLRSSGRKTPLTVAMAGTKKVHFIVHYSGMHATVVRVEQHVRLS